ncbi:phage shock protein B [Vibrio ishigakensis]|uniref:Phage shock protein B n=1 Tax=Vibrio ishigakensis TaxID=1481914 RepID=A0A0B8QNK3_9VIBR|nr:phage shock protein B [Vibrio sp. JCM 19236]GAM76588.1 phage shock protein B [Vibrio ishigakensis]
MHYRSKRNLDQGLTEQEREQLQELSGKAVQMKQRIETLEKILDAETPGWRNK